MNTIAQRNRQIQAFLPFLSVFLSLLYRFPCKSSAGIASSALAFVALALTGLDLSCDYFNFIL